LEERILNKKIVEAEKDKKVESLFQTIAFRLDNHVYALDLMNIQEIIFARKIYKVPNTDEKLLGVLNLRGNIIPIYSIKLILNMHDSAKGQLVVDEVEKYIIVIKKERDVFGILIDGIYKNISATEDNYRSGEFLEKFSRNSLFSGVILEDEKEILVINLENLLGYIISLN